MAYTLPELSYAYDSLEPHFDARTMEIHHSKHHQAYITKLNAALESENIDTEGRCIGDLCSEITKLPESIQTAVRNNGGGHLNHSIFWKILCPKGGGTPVGELAKAIETDLGGFDPFKESFSNAAATRFGSGWAWLSVGCDGKVFVSSTANQDNPMMREIVEQNGIAVLGLDVWEHAYYLNYQNRRPDYIAAFFNVIDWETANNRYLKAVEKAESCSGKCSTSS
ncbi:MAG: superoxide dismutase [Pirellulaceae bacterium]|nr:superoxide dismutase [Pirellulaceae bacterium]